MKFPFFFDLILNYPIFCYPQRTLYQLERKELMNSPSNNRQQNKGISRRHFLKSGGSALAAGAIGVSAGRVDAWDETQEELPKIKEYRMLGRTGFKVSDIGMGGTRVTDGNVVRYAYDHGVNYFDTAEGYSNGAAERAIGTAMPHMDRSKIFITTKLHIGEEESESSILDRFAHCLERLQTDYVDCLYMHNPSQIKLLDHSGFHAAVKKLKSEGRLRFIGLSSHGPGRREGDSMEAILTAAAEDGRFDVMLMIYNYLNREVTERILAACKKNNVGTTAMKISPGFVMVDSYDRENPSPEQKRRLERMKQRGLSQDDAEQRLMNWMKEQDEEIQKYKPFLEQYDIQNEQQLRKATIQFVFENPDMHTVLVSFSDFDLVDQVIPVSGTRLSSSDHETLKYYGQLLDKQYCRHGCSACFAACPHGLPVSSIMRYAYYFNQGREKYAMQKYQDLNDRNALSCHGCSAPCLGQCPHQVNVQAQLVQAHSLLSLA